VRAAAVFFALGLSVAGCHHDVETSGNVDLGDGGVDADLDPGTEPAVLLYHAPKYLAREIVNALRSPVGTSQVVTARGYAADQTWRIDLEDADGEHEVVMSTSADFPNHALDAESMVATASVVVFWLSDLDTGENKVAAVPLLGGPSFVLAEHVIGAQVSSDGNTLNYVAGDRTADWVVASTPIDNPPTASMLGTLPLGELDGKAFGLFAAQSKISNTPRVVLQTKTGTRAFAKGIIPPPLDTDGSSTPRFVDGFAGSETAFLPSGMIYDFDVEATRGATGSVSNAHLALVRAGAAPTAIEIVDHYGNVTDATLPTALGSAALSFTPDDSHAIVFRGGNLGWEVVDAMSGVVVHGSYPSTTSTLLGATPDGSSLYISVPPTPGAAHCQIVAVTADGSSSAQLAASTPDCTPYGDFAVSIEGAVLFPDGVGLYVAQPDGTNKLRLDPPKNDEASIESMSSLERLWTFSSQAQRVIFTDFDDTVDFDSSPWLFSLRSATLSGSTTTLMMQTKMTGQIDTVWPLGTDGPLLMRGIDGSRGDTGTLLLGTLSADPLVTLSPPLVAGVRFGPGISLDDLPPQSVPLGGPGAVLYNYAGHGTASTYVETIEGTAISTLAGYRFRGRSVDGATLALTDDSNHLALAPLDGSSAPMPLFSSLTVKLPDLCPGCRDPYTDGAILLGPQGHLLVASSAGVYAGKTDGSGLSDLQATSFVASSDGTRAILVSKTAGDLVAETLGDAPSGQPIAHGVTDWAVSADASWVLYLTGTSVQSLRAVQFDGTGDHEVVAVGGVSYLSGAASSADRLSWVVPVFSTATGDPSCMVTLKAFVLSAAAHDLVTLPCSSPIFSIDLSRDGSRVVYRARAASTGAPVQLTVVPFDGSGPPELITAIDESAVASVLSPDGRRALVTTRRTDGSHAISLLPIDGSAGKLLGTAAAGVRIHRLTFLSDAAAVMAADFAQPGRLDLYRLDLPP
jgi:hypothetical protein